MSLMFFSCSTLYALLSDLPPSTRASVASIAFDGTSATAMLVQRSTGAVLAPAKLYNESQEDAAVQRVKVLQAVQCMQHQQNSLGMTYARTSDFFSARIQNDGFEDFGF